MINGASLVRGLDRGAGETNPPPHGYFSLMVLFSDIEMLSQKIKKPIFISEFPVLGYYYQSKDLQNIAKAQIFSILKWTILRNGTVYFHPVNKYCSLNKTEAVFYYQLCY